MITGFPLGVALGALSFGVGNKILEAFDADAAEGIGGVLAGATSTALVDSTFNGSEFLTQVKTGMIFSATLGGVYHAGPQQGSLESAFAIGSTAAIVSAMTLGLNPAIFIGSAASYLASKCTIVWQDRLFMVALAAGIGIFSEYY